MRRFLVALLLLTSLGGCSLFKADSPLPTAIDPSVLNQLPRIEPSRRDTCETQKQVARQESYIKTVQQKREVVVVAACQGAPSQKVAANG